MTSCNLHHVEQNIVLINVDTLDREGIANQISIINSLKPKVIALDLQFSTDTEYDKDTHLIQELDHCKNLVMLSIIENYTGEDIEYKRFEYGSLPDYATNAKTGFGNAILEKDEFQTLKRFSILEKVNVGYEYHFAIRTAMQFDSLKTMGFIKGKSRIIDVDYKDGKRKFKSFSANDILNKNLSEEDINGKIILMGYIGPTDEDKFYTPLNNKKNPIKPDMYGLVFMANIISQTLE